MSKTTKIILTIVGVLVVVGGIIVGVILIGRNQEIREKADTGLTQPSEPKLALCLNRCGDAVCDEIVCTGEGCPCAETTVSCPNDCQQVVSQAVSSPIPSPSPSPSSSPSPTPSVSSTPSPSATASATPTPTATASATLPDAGVSSPTLVGLGIGLLAILASILLAI